MPADAFILPGERAHEDTIVYHSRLGSSDTAGHNRNKVVFWGCQSTPRMEVWYIGKYGFFSWNNLLIKIYSTMHRWVKLRKYSHHLWNNYATTSTWNSSYSALGLPTPTTVMIGRIWICTFYTCTCSSLRLMVMIAMTCGHETMRCMSFHILLSTAHCHIKTLINSTLKISSKTLRHVCSCFMTMVQPWSK